MSIVERAGEADLRHLLLLEELERTSNVSQRTLARRLEMATSVVNHLIHELVEEGHVEIVDTSVRPYAYDLTEEGARYRRRLSHRHYRSVLGSYRKLQDRIRQRLHTICDDGIERLVFYGTGDMMEATLPVVRRMKLDVVGLVDDDPDKHGQRAGGLTIQPPTSIGELDPDAVLITTVRHAEEIQERIGPILRERVQVLEL